MIKHIKKGFLMAVILSAALSLAGCPKEAGSSGGGGTTETLSLNSIQGNWIASVPTDYVDYYEKIIISGTNFRFESNYVSWEAEIKNVYPKNNGEGYITLKCLNYQPSTEYELSRNTYENTYTVLLFGNLKSNSYKLGVSYEDNMYKPQEYTLANDYYEGWIDRVKKGNVLYNRQ